MTFKYKILIIQSTQIGIWTIWSAYVILCLKHTTIQAFHHDHWPSSRIRQWTARHPWTLWICSDFWIFVQRCLPFYPEFYLLPVLVLVELLYQSLNLLLIPRTEVYKHLRHRPTRKLPQSHLSLQLRMQVFRCWLWLSDGCLSVAFSRYGIGAPAWARLHRSCRCCPHRAIRRWASPVSFMKSHKKSWVLNCKFQIMSMCMMCMCVCNFSKCQIQRYLSICHKVQDIFWENQSKSD